MNYCELAPVPELAGIVECLWVLEGDAGSTGKPEAVLPDGRPELILHFGDRFERVTGTGECVVQPSMTVAGQITAPLLLRPTGRVSVLGVRFVPHGAASVFAVPQHELAGLTIDVDALSVHSSGRTTLNRSASGLRRELEAVADCACMLRDAAAAAQRVLVRWAQPARIDPRVRFAVDAIQRSHGLVPVHAVARGAAITTRHLERRFLESVGVSPKRLARMARFQHAVRMLQQCDRRRPGAETAAACGYADQSHFIRDFRQLAGCAPSEHLLRMGELTGFFSGGGWAIQPS